MITTNPKRIEDAHFVLQRLEDEVVGCMLSVDKLTVAEVNQVYCRRLEAVHAEIWHAISLLNEAYDRPEGA